VKCRLSWENEDEAYGYTCSGKSYANAADDYTEIGLGAHTVVGTARARYVRGDNGNDIISGDYDPGVLY